MPWGCRERGRGLVTWWKLAVQQGKTRVSPSNHGAEVLGELLEVAGNSMSLWSEVEAMEKRKSDQVEGFRNSAEGV